MGAGATFEMGLLEKIAAVIPMGGGTGVGVSIGSFSVKLVELKKSGKSWKLLNAAIGALPEDSIVNRDIVNQLAVVGSIKDILGRIKLKQKNICTSVSGTAVIIKKLSVDAPKKSDLEGQVFWEAEQYLPFDPSEVAMDFHVLSRAKDGKTDVILVAAKRSVLDAYMATIEDSGLRPKIVDTDYFALQTVFEANYPTNPNESVALVDIGASSLKLVVVFQGVPVFTKDSALGGHNLTVEIQKNLGLPYKDAEALKTGTSGRGIPQEVGELIAIMNENFATEIKRTLDFYGAQSTGAPITQIFITGGASKVGGLTKAIEEICHITCQTLNPFHSISYDPSQFTPESIALIGPHLSIPIGLAIRAVSK